MDFPGQSSLGGSLLQMQPSTKECQVVGIASPKMSNSTKVGKGGGEDKHQELKNLRQDGESATDQAAPKMAHGR